LIEGYHNSKTNEIVKNTLGEIYENLIKNYAENHIGLMSGSTGTLLFLSEYEHLNSFTDNSFSQKIIENILDKINSGYNLPTFAYKPQVCSFSFRLRKSIGCSSKA